MMPLPEQEIKYNLGFGGVDTFSSDKFAPLGRPRELVNVRFPKVGTIGMRPALCRSGASSADLYAGTIGRIVTDGKSVLAFTTNPTGSRALIRLPNDGSALSASPEVIDASPPVPKAWVDDISTSLDVLASSSIYNNTPTVIDAVVGATLTAYLINLGTTAQSYVQLVETATGRTVATTVELGALMSSNTVYNGRLFSLPDVSGNPTDVFVCAQLSLFAGTSSILVALINNTGVIASDTTLSSVVDNSTAAPWKVWDAVMIGQTLFLTYRKNGSANLAVKKMAITSSALGAFTSGSDLVMTTGPLCVRVCDPRQSDTTVMIVAFENTNGTRGVTVTLSSLAVATALWIIDGDHTLPATQLAGIILSSGYYVLKEAYSGSVASPAVRKYTGAIGGAATVSTQVPGYIGSRLALTKASNNPFFYVAYYSHILGAEGLQHGRVLYEDETPVAVLMRGDADPPPVTYFTLAGGFFLPSLSPVDTTKMEFVCGISRVLDNVVDEVGSNKIKSIAAMRFSLRPGDGYETVADGPMVLMTGGYLSIFDGRKLRQNGFTFWPEFFTAASSVGAGALTSSTKVKLVAVAVRTDGGGQKHRSAPSDVVSVTLGPADNTITCSVGVPFSRDAIDIELYRTVGNLGTFYLCDYKRGVTSSASFTVVGSDANLTANTPLAQQGSIIQHAQPNCPISIAASGKRMMVVAGDRRHAVLQGKAREIGDGVSFLSAIERQISAGGNIEALTTIGERWVALKKDQVFVAAGDGSDASGQNDTLSEFELHPTIGVGVSDVRSVLKTPIGVVFKSSSGFYMLDTAGGLTQQTAIDDFSGSTVIAAAYNNVKKEAHLLLATGERLVLHMVGAQTGAEPMWTNDLESKNAAGVSAATLSDLAVKSGVLWASVGADLGGVDPFLFHIEDATKGDDRSYNGGAGFGLMIRLRIGWLPIGDEQNNSRLKAVKVLGKIKAQTQALLGAQYDYDDEIPSSPLGANYDDNRIVTANTGAGSAKLQFEWRPQQQKGQALMLQICAPVTSAVAQTPPYYAANVTGIELNQIVLTIAVRPRRRNSINRRMSSAS